MKSIDITKSLKNTVLISLSIFAFVMFTFYNKMSPLSTESLNKTSEVVLLQSSTDTIDQNEMSESVVFDEIYKKNIWGVGSGSGSFAENTVEYRAMLQKIFDDDRYQSFVDFGCGDFQIMKLMKVPLHKSYVGLDVVAHVIEENERLYGVNQNTNYKFHHVEDLETLNRELRQLMLKGDMIIAKDVLQHLPNQNIQYFIDHILPHFKYALITNDYSTTNNEDILEGQYRSIDLAAPPFNLTNLQVILEYGLDFYSKRVSLYTNPFQ